MRQTKNIKGILANIYKASDCCDLSDCQIAIDRIYEMFGNEWIKNSPAVSRRLNSLILKKKQYA